MQHFNDLLLPESISKALKAMAFETPTPIQAEAIPPALEKRDLIGCAQTGTGKTAAFCIPTLVRLLRSPGKIALVLVPTRELAAQIEEFWKKLTAYTPGIGCASLIGGLSMKNQVRSLSQRPRFIVATPGRLIDHLNRGSLTLSQTEILILDEADRMLDMGFAPQLEQVLRFLPKTRQTLLFTATLASTMDRFSQKCLKDPVRVVVGNSSQAAPKITQTVISTPATQKNNRLLDEVNQRKGSVLVFARTQARTDRVARYLSGFGLPVGRIHGGRSQAQRSAALAGFKTGKVRILIATDIAARGIDVMDIAHVINYDLPDVPEDYIHRIGRTARAGASGQAASFLTPEDGQQWRQIVQLLKRSGSQVPEIVPSGAVESDEFQLQQKKRGFHGQTRSSNPSQAQSRASEARETAGKARRARIAQRTQENRGPQPQFR